ncbi:Acyl-CoA dehydrogenase/oxidase, N-terminal and middle domain superfamily [Sesbania bispinosa]|nr:Acyl-CoA dehydrogenase/oxidase, N-terminal and middle domain superfamily [Sesbania bispinosa]
MSPMMEGLCLSMENMSSSSQGGGVCMCSEEMSEEANFRSSGFTINCMPRNLCMFICDDVIKAISIGGWVIGVVENGGWVDFFGNGKGEGEMVGKNEVASCSFIVAPLQRALSFPVFIFIAIAPTPTPSLSPFLLLLRHHHSQSNREEPKEHLSTSVMLKLICSNMLISHALLFVRYPAANHDHRKFIKKKLVGIVAGSTTLDNSWVYNIHIEKEIWNFRKEDMDLPTFDLPIIVKATNNFSSINKLGEGGFGLAYKYWEKVEFPFHAIPKLAALDITGSTIIVFHSCLAMALTEPDYGSDASSFKTTATKVQFLMLLSTICFCSALHFASF